MLRELRRSRRLRPTQAASLGTTRVVGPTAIRDHRSGWFLQRSETTGVAGSYKDQEGMATGLLRSRLGASVRGTNDYPRNRGTWAASSGSTGAPGPCNDERPQMWLGPGSFACLAADGARYLSGHSSR